MMKRLMLYISVLATAATACTERFQEAETSDRTIDLHTQIDGETASKGVVVNTSPLTGVQFLRKDSTATPKDFAGITPLAASRAANGAIAFTTAPTYALDNKNAYFVAYHPAGTRATNVVTWTIDGKTDILSSAVYDAGKYTAPGTNTMTFAHQLAQLEIVCQADPSASVAEADVQTVWGNITKIELLNTPTELKYTYSTNKTTNGTTTANKVLLQKDCETTFTSVAITKNATAVVTAAGMFAPSTATTPLTVRITTAKRTYEVPVQLKSGNTNKGFEAAKKHTVTLVFKATQIPIQVLSTQITNWGEGNTASSVVDPRSIRMVYGQPPFLNFIVTTGTAGNMLYYCGSTTTSYNSWTGTVESGNNGQYITSIGKSWVGEVPYYSLDVGYGSESTIPVDWAQARTLCQSKTTDGGGWRLPRITELMWIAANNQTLTALPGYVQTNTDLFSATEQNKGSVWCLNANTAGAQPTSTLLSFVRCVREAPMPTIPTRTMHYGQEPFSGTGDLFGATSTETYNSWIGTVATKGNGTYQSEVKEAYADEKPFARLEVASDYETQTMSWADACVACRNKTTDGGGWRLPRISELRWIFINATKLSTVPGTSVIDTPDQSQQRFCWSATEASLSMAHYYDMEDTWPYTYGNKNELMSVLCVRAFSFNTMFYGKAPFSSTEGLYGSTTKSYNSWKGIAGGAADGGNGNRCDDTFTAYLNEPPYDRLEVAPIEFIGVFSWQEARQKCWDLDSQGSGWRLPRISELQWIYANRVALASLPGFQPFYTREARTLSATQYSSAGVWGITFSTRGYVSISETTPQVVRCVREV